MSAVNEQTTGILKHFVVDYDGEKNDADLKEQAGKTDKTAIQYFTAEEIKPTPCKSLDVREINPKKVLKAILFTIKEQGKDVDELVKILEKGMQTNPDSKDEYLEAISLLNSEMDTASKQIDSMGDSTKQVESLPGYNSSWTSYACYAGSALWVVTKAAGSVLYFVTNNIIFNGTVLQVASAVGGIASVINLVGNPCLPVMQSVVMFVLQKVIH